MKQELNEELRKRFNGKHKTVAHLATVDAEAGYAPEIRTMTLLEDDWRFYIASSVSDRKVRELRRHPLAAFLVYFHDGKNAGYLRVTGSVEAVPDTRARNRIAEKAEYPLACRWKGGAASPELYFARIVPKRVEYLRPGEERAANVTPEFPL
ncbi:MAG: pyridoxamine 5'-phosphate oxidase family protein [Elusimicrobia bacterium]|nr:pyridoxamine 5'-phosphate oxidase family protein [Elusimicrobiota bacterium]